MSTVIAKNQTAGALALNQLPVPDNEIPASGQVTLTDFASISEIQEDTELTAHIAATDAILNVDGVDLSVADSTAWVSPLTVATIAEVDAGTVGDKAVSPVALSGSALASDVTTNNAKVTNATHTGDVTGATALTIAADAVTFAKMQNIATDRLLGRDTAATGDTEELTVGGGVEFTGAGGIQRSALTGDVTASAGSGATTIAADAVTNAKLADMAQALIKGRASGAGTGNPTDLTATQARTVLNVEDGADVTDTTNVAAAGAVMDSDISEAEGFLRKTGAGAYEAVKSNLGATTDPGATDDSAAGYAVGSVWINVTLDKVWQCVDNTATSAVWKDLSSASGTLDHAALTSNLAWTSSGHTGAVSNLAGFTGAGAADELTATEVRTLINVEDGADVTDAANVNAAGAVMEADYNAQTVLVAVSDDTPVATTVADSEFVGRPAGGNVGVLTATEARTVLNVEDGSVALPIVDTTAVVKGSADATKLVRIEVDGLTTVTTRVITMPDKDVTLDDAGDSRPPSGTAGGSLGGTFPNPTVDDGADGTAIHDNVAGEIAAITLKNPPVSGDLLLIEDSADSNSKKYITVGSLPTGGGGEANTASNVNTAGVGVFKQKTALDLEFRGVKAASAKATVALDAGTNEIRVDVADASATQAGAIEIADQAEVDTGTDTTRAVVPDTLANSALAGDVATNTAKVTNATHTGEVTGSGALTITADAVTNAKLANVATATFKGRVTAATGDPEDLTGTQATTLLDPFTTALQGVVPASGGVATDFLSADGSWSVPAGSGGQTNTVVGSNGISNVGTNVDADLAPTYGTTAGRITEGNDARLSDARVPTGAAGGSLTGTYPNPGVADGADGTAIHDNVAGEIAAIAVKGSPVGADFILIEDSAAANAKKHILISSLPGGGGAVWTVATETTAARAAASGEFVLVNAATCVVTLPAPAADSRVACKAIAVPATATSIEIRTSVGGVLIDGTDYSSTGLALKKQFEMVNVISDGTDWFIY